MMNYHDLYENLRHKLDQERADRSAAEARLAVAEQKLKWSEEKLAYEQRRAKHAEEMLALEQRAAAQWEKMYDDANNGRAALMERICNA